MSGKGPSPLSLQFRHLNSPALHLIGSPLPPSSSSLRSISILKLWGLHSLLSPGAAAALYLQMPFSVSDFAHLVAAPRDRYVSFSSFGRSVSRQGGLVIWFAFSSSHCLRLCCLLSSPCPFNVGLVDSRGVDGMVLHHSVFSRR